jgi:histidinol-phosphate aminotransferase
MQKNILNLSRAEGVLTIKKKILRNVDFDPKSIAVLPEKHKYNELKEKIAQLYKCSEEQICLGNGSDELIEAISRLNQKDSSLTVIPTFERLYEVNKKHNKKIRYIKLQHSDKFKYNDKVHSRLLSEIKKNKPGIVWLCTPNNPTGTIIDELYIIEIAECDNKTLVVVDQAFADFNKGSVDSSLALITKNFKNLILINSFSKTWGLSGLRIGFSISNSEAAKKIKSATVMFNVNTVALSLATKCLDEPEYRNSQFIKINDNFNKIKKQLMKKNRYEIVSNSNIGLFCIKHIKTTELHELLIANGILTKNLNKVEGMNNYGYCRVQVPINSKDLKFLINILEKIDNKI